MECTRSLGISIRSSEINCNGHFQFTTACLIIHNSWFVVCIVLVVCGTYNSHWARDWCRHCHGISGGGDDSYCCVLILCWNNLESPINQKIELNSLKQINYKLCFTTASFLFLLFSTQFVNDLSHTLVSFCGALLHTTLIQILGISFASIQQST